LYKDNAGEQPPAALDNLILAKARGQTTDGPHYRKTRWHVPVVLCMVPAIALGVVLKLGNFGRGGDFSLEGSHSSNVYSTEDFVLHVPRASDAITRPEKPDFSTNSVASSDIQSMTAETQNRSRAPETREAVVARAEVEINVPVAAPELTKRQPDTYKNEELVAAAPWSPPVATICNDDECMVSDMDNEEGMQASSTSNVEITDDMADVMASSAPSSAPQQSSAGVVAMSKPPAKVSNAAKRQAVEKIIVSYQDHYQECPLREERAQMCTREYAPVCAERDTGIRCVLPPCSEATEMKTYSNACTACADLDVYGYYGEGACEVLIIETSE